MTSVLVMVAVAGLGQSTVKINDCWQTNLDDLSFTASVVSANQRELAKINKDFANSYRFKSTKVQMKEPLKLRLESTVDDMDIVFVLNGATRVVKIPTRGIRNKENLAKAPGKRQTGLDFGFLTPGLFSNLFVAKFVRTDRATGQHVFDLTYPAALEDTSRQRVFVDGAKKMMVKREWYNQAGFLNATFIYEEAKQFGSIWLPTKVTVKNSENKVAGTTNYTNIRVNSGIADKQFSVD